MSLFHGIFAVPEREVSGTVSIVQQYSSREYEYFGCLNLFVFCPFCFPVLLSGAGMNVPSRMFRRSERYSSASMKTSHVTRHNVTCQPEEITPTERRHGRCLLLPPLILHCTSTLYCIELRPSSVCFRSIPRLSSNKPRTSRHADMPEKTKDLSQDST